MDSDGDDEQMPPLPFGATMEQVEALVKQAEEDLAKIGLYAEPAAQSRHGDDELYLLMNFRVGDVAFTKRVQDPETDKTDDVIRGMESNAVFETRDEIIERYKRKGQSHGDS
jgi:hypothetical protein